MIDVVQLQVSPATQDRCRVLHVIRQYQAFQILCDRSDGGKVHLVLNMRLLCSVTIFMLFNEMADMCVTEKEKSLFFNLLHVILTVNNLYQKQKFE